MCHRYIAFDVETPNYANNRISALGITVVENGRLTESFYSLVNPEAQFAPFHMELTGITPDMVKNQPTFGDLWHTIEPILHSGLLVAHNAPFDMAVLAKCLRDYGITWCANVPYVCTCQISRRLLPQLPNHRLDTLCKYFHLNLHHHRADSDSQACAEILLRHLRSGAYLSPFIRTYDMIHICTAKSSGFGWNCGSAQ